MQATNDLTVIYLNIFITNQILNKVITIMRLNMERLFTCKASSPVVRSTLVVVLDNLDKLHITFLENYISEHTEQCTQLV